MAARKVALVTGAGSGIGRASAVALAQHGFVVVLAGRRIEQIQATAGLIDGATHVVTVDVMDPQSVSAMFDTVNARVGRLDVLFNNAGMDVGRVPFDELTFDDWSRVIGTNLTGQFLCAQGAFRMMRAQQPQGGLIINNGSIAAHAPRPNSAPYTASKHGVTGLTKAIILDGRAYGITAAQIDVGNATDDPDAPRDAAIQASGHSMVEPYMRYETVARTVAFMATMPPGSNMPFVTVMATNMPFVGRG